MKIDVIIMVVWNYLKRRWCGIIYLGGSQTRDGEDYNMELFGRTMVWNYLGGLWYEVSVIVTVVQSCLGGLWYEVSVIVTVVQNCLRGL